jgi:hypothetical protein
MEMVFNQAIDYTIMMFEDINQKLGLESKREQHLIQP